MVVEMGELRRAAEQVRKEIEAAQLDKARFSVAEKETQEFNMATDDSAELTALATVSLIASSSKRFVPLAPVL